MYDDTYIQKRNSNRMSALEGVRETPPFQRPSITQSGLGSSARRAARSQVLKIPAVSSSRGAKTGIHASYPREQGPPPPPAVQDTPPREDTTGRSAERFARYQSESRWAAEYGSRSGTTCAGRVQRVRTMSSESAASTGRNDSRVVMPSVFWQKENICEQESIFEAPDHDE